MNCQDVRPHLLDYQRGRLGADAQEAIRAHLDGCAACAHEEAAEQALTQVLEEQLPQHAAPLALKRRLAAHWPVTAVPRPSWWSRWGRSLVPAFAVATVLLFAIPLYYYQQAPVSLRDGPGMVTEAVNDHLRILSSQHPLDIESGGMHQVKPWFEGRLDFAPVVSFLGDEEFPLQGGAVGYFLDRKAAVFVVPAMATSSATFPPRDARSATPLLASLSCGGIGTSSAIKHSMGWASMKLYDKFGAGRGCGRVRPPSKGPPTGSRSP